jgi:Kef-type K+ transport system membrane component KefB
MQHIAEFLFAIGVLLLLGLATDYLGRRTFLPRVTLLLIFGIIVGDEILGIIPLSVSSRFELITVMALLMIGFLLGGKLALKSLKKEGHQLIWISLSAAVGTTIIVTLSLFAIGVSMEIAILLGCIAAATAPAATVDTVQAYGSKSTFSRLLLAITAIDDAWAMILFSFGLALVSLLNGMQDSSVFLMDAAYEIIGALLLGGLIGLPAAYLTGRIKPGEPMLTEALGLVFICGGIALWFEVSFLIAAMTMGAVIANLAKHHDYPFHEIENIEWPFMIIFFMLAGASLEIGMLAELGLVGIVYLGARIGGKLIGAWLGARVSQADKNTQRWMGMALLPQAGVAIGMALLVVNQFPEYRQTILSIVISTTVFFELVGPVFTRLALRRT